MERQKWLLTLHGGFGSNAGSHRPEVTCKHEIEHARMLMDGGMRVG
jgi:hypothetical protein